MTDEVTDDWRDLLADAGLVEVVEDGRASAGPVVLRREAAMIHGFLTLDTRSPAAAAAGQRVFDDMTRLIKSVL